jgi:hypothetical protein
VEQLLHQAVLQSIRGMLPVKSILREYLSNDVDGEANEESSEKKDEKEDEDEEEEEKEVKEEEVKEENSISIDLSGSQVDASGGEIPAPPPTTPIVEAPEIPPVPETVPEALVESAPASDSAPAPPVQQVLVFETEPSVKFADHDTVFDTENQMEHRIRSKSADFDENGEDGIKILDDAPQAMDDFEDIDGAKDEGLDDFETLE